MVVSTYIKTKPGSAWSWTGKA